MSDAMENPSFSTVIKKCMKEVYEYHQALIQDAEDNVSELKSDNDDLGKQVERLKHEVLMLKDRMEGLQTDNQRLKDDLVNTSTRLSAPCESCKSSRQQIEQQNQLLYSMMEKKDLSLTHILEKYLNGCEQRPQNYSQKFEPRNRPPSILQTLSQAILASQNHSKDDLAKDGPNRVLPSQDNSESMEESNGLLKSKNLWEKGNKNKNKMCCDFNQHTYDKHDGNNTNRTQEIGYSECNIKPAILEDNMDKKCGTSPADKNKISPDSSKLKLNRTGKRCRYIEEVLPESKKKKISQKSLKENLHHTSSSEKCQNFGLKQTVLAPDTCDVTLTSPDTQCKSLTNDVKTQRNCKPLQNKGNVDIGIRNTGSVFLNDTKTDYGSNGEDNKRYTRSQKERMKIRPHITIPETVAMEDIPSSDEENDNSDNSQRPQNTFDENKKIKQELRKANRNNSEVEPQENVIVVSNKNSRVNKAKQSSKPLIPKDILCKETNAVLNKKEILLEPKKKKVPTATLR